MRCLIVIVASLAAYTTQVELPPMPEVVEPRIVGLAQHRCDYDQPRGSMGPRVQRGAGNAAQQPRPASPALEYG